MIKLLYHIILYSKHNMNFYSDKIINSIIDNEELDTIIESIEKFGENCFNLISHYSGNSINYNYVFNVLGNTKNIVAFHCIDNEFSIDNCPSILVYRKSKFNDQIIYYILIICTHKRFRNQGYASKLLDGFLERVKNENIDNIANNKIIKIILSSIEESVIFYETYGFVWTRKSIADYDVLMNFEKYDEDKEYFIMEYDVNKNIL